MDSNQNFQPKVVKPLTELALKQLDQFSSQGRIAWKQGDIENAEKYFFLAWDCIPEPKIEFDYTQSMSRGFVEFYRATAQYQKAKDWIEILRSTYGRPQPKEHASDYVDFIAAMVFFDAGELDEAFTIFDRQFKKYKTRPFQGRDKKYLEFYKEEIQKRRLKK